MIAGMLLVLIGAILYAIRSRRWEGTALAVTAALLTISSGTSILHAYWITANPDRDWTFILTVLAGVDFLLFALLGLFILLILNKK